MDKRVIFAVAGSGKTTYIHKNLEEDSRALLITYTRNNVENLIDGIVRKFGYFPPQIKVYSLFTFLYKFCFRPYLSGRIKCRGLSYHKPPKFGHKDTERRYYFTKGNRLYHRRLSKYLAKTETLDLINGRIARYFDEVWIDEIQDFAGHDFNFLKSLSKAKIKVTFVGDYFQHTVASSRDGTVNKPLHKDYESYQRKFRDMGLEIDTQLLDRSYRISQDACDFITNNLGIKIDSHGINQSKIVIVDSQEKAEELFFDNRIVKLFYQDRVKYPCYGRNWGEVKGDNHHTDVCVFLNGSTQKSFDNGTMPSLANMTRNKLYVACSRAKGTLYIAPEQMIKKFKKSKVSSA